MLHSCIDITDLSQVELERLIERAEDIMERPEEYQEACRGKILATLFYEPSTRTRLSFTSAMLSLGGTVLGFSDAQNSSVSKGETVADTIRVVSHYADIVAMRHHLEGAPLVASLYGSLPVINAGDGSHAHPTQTLTDLLTIHRELGRLDRLTIGLCGDLKYGRTVHSLLRAMTGRQEIHFVLISPDNLRLPEYMLRELEASPNLSYQEVATLEEAMDKLDVLYMTRVQRERFLDLDEYERSKDCFVLDEEKMRLASQEMIVLHPLPRVGEISPEVDNDPRAAYFRQAGNGRFIRMALILHLLEKNREVQLSPRVPRLKSEMKPTENHCQHRVCISRHEPLPQLCLERGGKSYCAYCEHEL